MQHNPSDLVTERNDVEELVRHWRGRWEQHGFGSCCAFEEATGRLIGTCVVRGVPIPGNRVRLRPRRIRCENLVDLLRADRRALNAGLGEPWSMTLGLSNPLGPVSWMTSRNPGVETDAPAERCADRAGVIALMTARKQAQAAWRSTSRYSVDELEALILAQRREARA